MGFEPTGGDSAAPWWHPRSIPESHTLRCQIGPLALSVCHGGGEWRLSWKQGAEDSIDHQESLTLEQHVLDEEKMERHVFKGSTDLLQLRPRLLDRPVVIRPRQPIFLPPGESTILYLSSPLCVGIEVSEPAVELRELAMLRLSDTWFGPSTREGELCFAGRTHARHDLESLPRRPHRAITPVRVENRSTDKLPLEKLSLPVPALSLYGAADGTLWTQELALVRNANTDHANLEIGNPPEALVDGLELLAPPRKPSQRGGLVRAFGLIFGN